MEHCGLTKDDIQQLFESLELLNRLTEDCFASDARDSHISHHHSDVQTAAHECDMAAAAASFSDSHQTTDDAIPNERPPTSRAARTSNAHETARVDLMAKSFDHHDVVPLSFHSSPMNDRIQHTVSTESSKRHSNDCSDHRPFIASATNGCQAARVSKR